MMPFFAGLGDTYLRRAVAQVHRVWKTRLQNTATCYTCGIWFWSLQSGNGAGRAIRSRSRHPANLGVALGRYSHMEFKKVADDKFGHPHYYAKDWDAFRKLVPRCEAYISVPTEPQGIIRRHARQPHPESRRNFPRAAGNPYPGHDVSIPAEPRQPHGCMAVTGSSSRLSLSRSSQISK